MTKITGSQNCGNSPKNILLEKISIALALGDAASLVGSLSEEVRWELVGSRLLRGRHDVEDVLAQIKKEKVAEIVIHHVATHGRAGAVNGTKRLVNGQAFAFCDVYEFSNAKATSVSDITSYVIQVKAGRATNKR